MLTALTLATVVLDSTYAGKDKGKKHCAKRGRKRITSCKPGFMYKANKTLARAANIDEGTFLCLNHRDEVKRMDNRCSFPASSSHSKSLVAIPERLYVSMDSLGIEIIDYRPGTKWCTACRKDGEQKLKDKTPSLYVPPKRRKVSSIPNIVLKQLSART